MAIQKNPAAADATSAYTVLRAFYWAGEVAPVGSVLQLTTAQAAELKAANKVAPGGDPEPADKPTKPAKGEKPAAKAD